MNKITMAAAMALLVVLTLSQAPLILGNPTVSNVKFRLPTYDNVKISFSENMIADRITLTSENITLENLQTASGSYTAPSQFFSVENADMTVDTLENDNVEFDLDASTGVESLATMTDGGRGEPVQVELNNVAISEEASLDALHAADNGWYYDNSDNTIYVKTTHASTNSVSIDWVEAAAAAETEEEELVPGIWAPLTLLPILAIVLAGALIIGIVISISGGRRLTDRDIAKESSTIVVVLILVALAAIIVGMIVGL